MSSIDLSSARRINISWGYTYSFIMLARVSTLLSIAVGALGHGDHGQTPLAGATESIWHNSLPGDGGTQV